jgi:hypothetical protein
LRKRLLIFPNISSSSEQFFMYHISSSAIIRWFLWSEIKVEVKTFHWNNVILIWKSAALNRITLWKNPIEHVCLTVVIQIILSEWIVLDFTFLKNWWKLVINDALKFFIN